MSNDVTELWTYNCTPDLRGGIDGSAAHPRDSAAVSNASTLELCAGLVLGEKGTVGESPGLIGVTKWRRSNRLDVLLVNS